MLLNIIFISLLFIAGQSILLGLNYLIVDAEEKWRISDTLKWRAVGALCLVSVLFSWLSFQRLLN